MTRIVVRITAAGSVTASMDCANKRVSVAALNADRLSSGVPQLIGVLGHIWGERAGQGLRGDRNRRNA